MKKKMIAAGAASLALAAMPVVGVFALDGSVGNSGVLTDKLVLTIQDNCAFSRGTVTADDDPDVKHTSGISGGSWATDSENTDLDVFTADVQNGRVYDGIATSNFKVVCNNLQGYQVTVNPSGFTTTQISGAESWNYNGGAYAGTGSSWYITSSHAGASLTGDNRVVATEASSTQGSDITVTYNVKVSPTQQAATYNATAAYTFAKLPVAGN